VPRVRGQQLKEPAQLDAWLRDGSADYVTRRCAFAHYTANGSRLCGYEAVRGFPYRLK
jgi:hypothetical protein